MFVSGGSGIKLAFVLGTWHGLKHDKCIRCFKPRRLNNSSSGQRFKTWSEGIHIRYDY